MIYDHVNLRGTKDTLGEEDLCMVVKLVRQWLVGRNGLDGFTP